MHAIPDVPSSPDLELRNMCKSLSVHQRVAVLRKCAAKNISEPSGINSFVGQVRIFEEQSRNVSYANALDKYLFHHCATPHP